MPNPYDITQVDVPGILGAYTSARQSRIQQMLAERQMAREDRDEERQVKREGLLAKVFQGDQGTAPDAAAKGGDPASTAPVAATPAPHPLDAVPQGAPASLVPPHQLPPRTDGVQLNHQALAQLYALDPATGQQLQNMVYQANKQQFEVIQRNGETMAAAAYRLKQVPPEQRAAELQAMAPHLQQMGLSPEQIAQADLSDAGLERYYALGRNLKDIIAEDKPHPRNVQPGDVIIDDKNPQAGAIFESPYVKGPDGQLYMRPKTQPSQAGATPKSKAEYDALPPGTPYVAPDGSHRVKGGAPSQGGGTFPGY